MSLSIERIEQSHPHHLIQTKGTGLNKKIIKKID